MQPGAAARWIGPTVSGLDASQNLIRVAQARTPEADLRVGDMFALPFPDGGFDVVTSFNGIWSGCEAALVEARRVLRPGGHRPVTPRQPSTKAEPADQDTPRRCSKTPDCEWIPEALEQVGPQKFGAELRKALGPFDVDGIGIRLPNEFGYITGTRP